MDKPIAFLVNMSDHGLSNILDFVEDVNPITTGNVNVFDLDRLEFDVKEALKDFNFEIDYIALNGSIILNFIVAKVIYANGQMFDKEIKLLLWDAKKREYKQKEL